MTRSRKHDKKQNRSAWDPRLLRLDGPPKASVVVPKLHNTSAGIEIYQLPPTLTKETFRKKQKGPTARGITKKYSNKRSGKKNSEVQGGYNGSVGARPVFHVSRLLGHLVEVPPATYRTMDLQEFQKGCRPSPNDRPSEFALRPGPELRAMAKSGSSKVVLPDGKKRSMGRWLRTLAEEGKQQPRRLLDRWCNQRAQLLQGPLFKGASSKHSKT